MKTTLRLTIAAIVLAAFNVSAATRYVSLESTNPVAPYATWATAATNIQDAVDAAVVGETVLVTNGTYRLGGRTFGPGLLLNRVVVKRGVRVQSVNGPAVTIIEGAPSPGGGIGEGAVRCASVETNAVLSGFTLTNGYSGSTNGSWDDWHGGGVICYHTATVTNCLITGNRGVVGGGSFGGNLYSCRITGNSAQQDGGGGIFGLFINCVISSNSAQLSGGGAAQAAMRNCTVTGNSAGVGGGLFGGSVTNCIVYFNNASQGANYDSSGLNYCCITPLQAGPGNISNDPAFMNPSSGNFRLQPTSPCIDAGDRMFILVTTDLDGLLRPQDGNGDGIAVVDMGAYEYAYTGAPFMVEQPASQTAYVGATVMLQATALGKTPLHYQWQRDGATLAGDTNATLSFSAVKTQDAGGYRVVVTNAVGSVTSQVAVLTVKDAAPLITQQPSGKTVFAGTNVTFTVAAVGSLPLSWQWRHNGADIIGATNQALNLNAVTTNHAGNYVAIVTNAVGSQISQGAVLTVLDVPPRILVQPANQQVLVGSNITFTVAAEGTLPLSFQWRHNGADIVGATNQELNLRAVTTNNAGNYVAIVTNAVGVTTSQVAVLTVSYVAPRILVQPANQLVIAGTSVTFTVAAEGSLPLSCQWRFNGSDILGATNWTLTLLAVTTNHSGFYTAVVSNPRGSLTSDTAQLLVLSALAAGLNPVLVGEWPGYLRGPANSVSISGTFAYVASGSAGLQVVDISNPTNVVRVGGCDTPGYARGVAVSGNYAFIADGYIGLTILNIADPTNCFLAGRFDTSGEACGVAVSGSYAYIADGDPGLQIINVSNPTNYVLAGSFDTPGNARGVVLSGNVAYVADGDAGLQVISVATPSNPWKMRSLDTDGFAAGVAVSGSYVYVADGGYGLVVVNVSTPSNPWRAGWLDTGGYANAVAMSGNYAFVADGEAGLRVINVATPSNPTLVASLDTRGYSQGLAVLGSRVFLADGDAGLGVVDVSSLLNPVEVGRTLPNAQASGVAVSGNHVYLADGNEGVQVIDVSAPSLPKQVASLETNGYVQTVAVSGNHLYTLSSVWDSAAGVTRSRIKVFDIASPASPVQVGILETNCYAQGLALSGNYAFTMLSKWDEVLQRDLALLQVMDVTSPANPRWMGAFQTNDYSQSLAASGNYAYMGSYRWDSALQQPVVSLHVIDVSIPASPRWVGSYETNRWGIQGMAVSGNYVYLLVEDSLHVIDVSTASNPRRVGGFGTYGSSVALAGHLAYVAIGETGVEVVDISNPSRPERVGRCDTSGSARGLALGGSYIYVADGPGGLAILDSGFPYLLNYPWPLTELAGTAAIEIRRTASGGLASTVHYRTVGGTASPGLDYIPAAGVFTFTGGESTAVLPLTVLDDALAEGTETIGLELIEAALGTTNRLTFKLVDNEIPVQMDGRFAWAAERTEVSFIDRYPDGRFLMMIYDYSSGQRLVRLTAEGREDRVFRATTLWPLVAMPDGGALCSSNSAHVIRLKPDGTADTQFQSPMLISNGWIESAAVQSDGKILVCLNSNANNRTTVRILRLQNSGLVDPSFAVSLFSSGTNSASVRRPLVQADGRIILFGNFTSVNGQSRRNLARLSAAGTLDASFAPVLSPVPPSDSVWLDSVSTTADGKLYLCGSFSGLGGTLRPGLLRLNPDGSLDLDFNAPVDVMNGRPYTIAALPDGGLLAGGGLMRFGGNVREGVAQLRADGSVAPSLYELPLQGWIAQLWADSPNGVIVQTAEYDLNGYPRSRLTRIFLDSTGLVGARFDASRVVLAEPVGALDVAVERLGDTIGPLEVAITTTGSAQRGLDFTLPATVNFAPLQSRQLLRIGVVDDGLLEGMELCLVSLTSSVSNFIPGTSMQVRIEDNEQPVVLDRSAWALNLGDFRVTTVLPAADGAIFIAGWGDSGPTIWRVLPGGQPDSDFQLPPIDGDISALVLTTDGKLLAGGCFSLVGTQSAAGLARFEMDGRFDPSFTPAESWCTRTLRVQHDGKILARFDGGLHRLMPDGRLDTTWTNRELYAQAMELVADGRLLVLTDTSVMRLLPDGAVDTSFHSPYFEDPNWLYLRAMAVDGQGRILVGGHFSFVDGVSRPAVARLTADGNMDPTFSGPGSMLSDGGNREVSAIACEPTGEILLSGYFQQVDEVSHPYLVWLDSNGQPMHNAGPNRIVPRTFCGPLPPSLALQPDGKVWVWEVFEVDGVAVPGIARIFPPGMSTGVRLEMTPPFVAEGSGNAVITVHRLGNVSSFLSARLMTRSGTAVAGADFGAVDAWLQFAPMETARSVGVPIFDDLLAEEDETFQIQVFDAESGRLLPGGEIRSVVLLDDDRRGSMSPGIFSPFISQPSTWIGRLGQQSGNRLLVGGDLWSAAPPSYRRLVRLTADGEADPSFQANASGWDFRVLPDDRILTWADEARTLSRLLPDGTVDSTFQLQSATLWTNRYIRSVEVQRDGKVLVSGRDDSSNYQGFIRRLLPNGSVDNMFAEVRLGQWEDARLLGLQNGRILLYGGFRTVAGMACSGLAVLKQDGTLDRTFAPVLTNNGIMAAAEAPDGRIVVAGAFSVNVGARTIWSVARFLPDGRPDPTFVGGDGTLDAFGNWMSVNAVAILSDSSLVVGGDFNVFHGQRRHKLAFLRPDGTLDPAADAGIDFRNRDSSGSSWSGYVSCIEPLSDGRIAVGGQFNRVSSRGGLEEMEVSGLIMLNGPVVLQFGYTEVLNDGTFRFSLQAEPGGTYVLESSFDLRHWTPVLTNRAFERVLVFDDLGTPGTMRRFFRAIRHNSGIGLGGVDAASGPRAETLIVPSVTSDSR